MNDLLRPPARLSALGARPETPRSIRVSWTILAATIWLHTATAVAQLSMKTDATGQFQYNSNVFDLQNGVPISATNGAPISGPNAFRYGDTYYAYTALADLNYQLSQQQFFLDASDTQYNYDHFTQLTHNEYNLDGGWGWKAGDLLNGVLEVSRSHTLVPFYDVPGSPIAYMTEQKEATKVDFQFVPDWRLEGSAFYHTITEPLPGTPDLTLFETSGTAALLYVARAGLTAGMSVNYLTGHYTGAPQTLDPAYQQTS